MVNLICILIAYILYRFGDFLPSLEYLGCMQSPQRDENQFEGSGEKPDICGVANKYMNNKRESSYEKIIKTILCGLILPSLQMQYW